MLLVRKPFPQSGPLEPSPSIMGPFLLQDVRKDVRSCRARPRWSGPGIKLGSSRAGQIVVVPRMEKPHQIVRSEKRSACSPPDVHRLVDELVYAAFKSDYARELKLVSDT
jgi:hypothetical protein